MYLGYLTPCLGGMSLKEKAKWAGENGFKALEVACWPHSDSGSYSKCDIDVECLTQKQADGIKEYMQAYGLTVTSLAYYDNNMHHEPKKRAIINRHTKKCIDAAYMLGVPAVGTFTGKNIYKSIKENFDDFEVVFGELAGYAEERGVKLIIENCVREGLILKSYPGTISYSPELWEEMFRRVPNKNFGLNLDPSHLFFQLIDYVAVIPKFKDRIFHVHAKDAEIFEEKLGWYGIFNRQLYEENEDECGYWRFRMPGMGQIDWQRFIKTLGECGYNGVISIEHEDPLYEGSEAKVKEGLIYGRKHLEQFI